MDPATKLALRRGTCQLGGHGGFMDSQIRIIFLGHDDIAVTKDRLVRYRRASDRERWEYMKRTTTRISGKAKEFWSHHKVWSVIIVILISGFFVLPGVSAIVDFVKDGSDPVAAMKAQFFMFAEFIGGGILLVFAIYLISHSFSIGGQPSDDALSKLKNRSTVHPQSDYRAQDRAAQEARDAVMQGREALHALERAGGDPSTIQELRWEINRAEKDAEVFQEWADD